MFNTNLFIYLIFKGKSIKKLGTEIKIKNFWQFYQDIAIFSKTRPM